MAQEPTKKLARKHTSKAATADATASLPDRGETVFEMEPLPTIAFFGYIPFLMAMAALPGSYLTPCSWRRSIRADYGPLPAGLPAPRIATSSILQNATFNAETIWMVGAP